MKKIPTLFKRVYDGNVIVDITDEVNKGLEWVLRGEGTATVKMDGSCCAIMDGMLYKRYDAKRGKNPPEGAIPCCEPDPVTGHWPHWLCVDPKKPDNKWFIEAMNNTKAEFLDDGTYEAVGPHFRSNPYQLKEDILIRHGSEIIEVDRSFEGIRQYLSDHWMEGIVFWKDGEPQCKIKRKDFGFPWP